MICIINYYRKLAHATLAVLVVAALSRCSWEEARELAQWSRTVAQHRLSLPSPIQSPIHDCDREAGCICRGATLVHAITVTQFQGLESILLPIDLDPATFLAVSSTNTFSLAAADFFDAPSISGRQLRALYASLVI